MHSALNAPIVKLPPLAPFNNAVLWTETISVKGYKYQEGGEEKRQDEGMNDEEMRIRLFKGTELKGEEQLVQA